MQKWLTCLVVGCMAVSLAVAQQYPLYLHSGTQVPPPVTDWAAHSQALYAAPTYQGAYHAILQFQDIPSAALRAKLTQRGISLLAYLPTYAYVARLSGKTSLEGLSLRTALPVQPTDKISPELLQQGAAATIEAIAVPYPGLSAQAIASDLKSKGWRVTQALDDHIALSLPLHQLYLLAAHPALMWLSAQPPAPKPEDIRSNTLQRTHALRLSSGLRIDGTGVAMSIAEDGTTYHLDLQGRLTVHSSAAASTHAAMTTSIAAGNGNINPLAIGTAPAADLHLFHIAGYPHIVNAPAHLQEHGIVMTSTSYGDNCGGYYTLETRALDQQVRQHTALLHCFSAGNSGYEACSPVYGHLPTPDGARYGNITGGPKAGKAPLTVGNLQYNDALRQTSSRGPAFDGRIKPDICTNGQGVLAAKGNSDYQTGSGTSAAAPAAMGAAALLYQAYRILYGNTNPPSALIKALILNTAEDLGAPGPDYTYGWGRLHAGRALAALEAQQFATSQIGHNQLNTHSIPVPAGIGQLRVMVYWNDPAGALMTSRALVNDLNTRLQTPTGLIARPWVLSIAPHADSLSRPAYPGTDAVNNMEQIVINQPSAGTYTLQVRGHTVPEGPQTYYVVYTFLRNDIQVSHPAGAEGFVPGETETIRWDALGAAGTFDLSYSLDSLATWIPIATQVPGSQRHFDWQVPNVVSGRVFVRVSRAGQSGTSVAACSIIGQPAFHFSTPNGQVLTLNWAPVGGATHYDIYRLGDTRMDIIGTTQGTTFSVPMAPWESGWFSVSAKGAGGAAGRRTTAKYHRQYPCQQSVNLALHFDTYPGETSWAILNEANIVYASGGPYLAPGVSSMNIPVCLPLGCYRLVVYDSFGDGMCCNSGNGGFSLTASSGEVLASGGAFGHSSSHPFCLQPSGNQLALSLGSIQNPSCFGQSDGHITVTASGGSGNYTLNWSNGQNGGAATGLAAGIHTVTLSDGGSSMLAQYELVQPEAPLSVSSSTYFDCQAGSGYISTLASGGTPPYQHLWSTGDTATQVHNLSAGHYLFTITDARGCSTEHQVTLGLGGALQLSTASLAVSCHGRSNGVAIVGVSGGSGNYQYQWSNGATTPAITQLPAGTYQVTVGDAGGCSATVTIEVPTPLPLAVQLTSPACGEASYVGYTALATGGTAPYTYIWSNGQASAHLGQVEPGTYIVTVTDAHGCSLSSAMAVPAEPVPMTVTAAVSYPSADSAAAHIQLTVAGGQAPYSYLWATGHSGASLTAVPPGTYEGIVTDATGCTTDFTVTVTAPTAPPQLPTVCTAQGSSTAFEWIERIEIGAFSHQSGNNGGYGNFLHLGPSLAIGQAVPISLYPGLTFANNGEYWRVWIDLNQDGDFDDPGEMLLQHGPSGMNVHDSLHIPLSALAGYTRLRVAIRYAGPPAPCGVIGYGEVEDYQVLLLPQAPAGGYLAGGIDISTVESGQRLRVSPNPARSTAQLRYDSPEEGKASWQLLDAGGRVRQSGVLQVSSGTNTYDLPLSGLPPGLYSIRLSQGGEGQVCRLLVL